MDLSKHSDEILTPWLPAYRRAGRCNKKNPYTENRRESTENHRGSWEEQKAKGSKKQKVKKISEHELKQWQKAIGRNWELSLQGDEILNPWIPAYHAYGR